MTSNPAAKMGLRRRPYAFTEHGVAMLASVPRSKRAIEVKIAIVRTFIRLRQMLAATEELARKVAQHDQEIGILFDHIQPRWSRPNRRRGAVLASRSDGPVTVSIVSVTIGSRASMRHTERR